jgi:hypothetical protein
MDNRNLSGKKLPFSKKTGYSKIFIRPMDSRVGEEIDFQKSYPSVKIMVTTPP